MSVPFSRIVVLVAGLMLLVVAMQKTTTQVPSIHQEQPTSEKVDLSDRDAEVIRFCLSRFDTAVGSLVPPSDPKARAIQSEMAKRIYFLTTTPLDRWSEVGGWAELPRSFHHSIGHLKTKYGLASGAYLSDGRVLTKRNHAEAWMRWVTIKRWISDTEVEVEEGVWCCPLGGGATTVIFEKTDGHWHVKEFVESWVS
jgi:hypothetical protein